MSIDGWGVKCLVIAAEQAMDGSLARRNSY